MDSEHCFRVASSRDGRFDGMFVTAVTTTRIYCRPSCPAVTPKRANVVFYPTPASAQEAGFRACKRCRPDSAPGSPEWDHRADTVARAVRLIADGVVERGGVEGLARRLGYTARHIHRLMTAEIGTGPLRLALAHRVSNARSLLESTDMDVTDVAWASGFGSVRRFNELVAEVYGCSPSELRRHAQPQPARHRWAGADPARLRELDGADRGRDRPGPEGSGPARQVVTARLAYRPPMDLSGLLDFLGRRAVPGVEHLGPEGYSRVLRLPRGLGVVRIPATGSPPGALLCRFELDDVRDYPIAVARTRRLLDLDADPAAPAAALGQDPWMLPLVAARPGLRVPGAHDGAELVVRAILGQQVSVSSARAAAGRLVAAFGHPVGASGSGPLRWAFPSMERLADARAEDVGITRARAETLRELARSVAGGQLELDAGADRDEAAAGLLSLRGVGAWTAGYVRMRALRDPDVLLVTDAGVRRALARRDSRRTPSPEGWRPWRSYATMHLWASLEGNAAGNPAAAKTGGRV